MNFSHTDTSKDAERVLICKIRLMDRKAKFVMMCSMSSSVFSLSKRAVRRAYPEFGELDMKIKFIGLNYGRKVAREYADYMKKNKNEQSVRH